ncbi:MAG: hypothetical protein AAF750_14200 [Planctomycetota bacterium]
MPATFRRAEHRAATRSPASPPARWITLLCLTLLPMSHASAQATQPVPADELTRLRAENAELRRELAQLKAELAQLRKGQEALTEETKQLQAETRQLAEEAERLTEQKQQLADEKQELAQEKQQLADDKEELQELAGVTTDGRIAEDADARIKSAYDAAADRTAYWIEFEEVQDTDRTRDPYFIAVRAEHPGQSPTADAAPTVRLTVFAQFSGRTHRSQLPLQVLIDGQPATDAGAGVPVAAYDRNPRSNRIGGKRQDTSDESLAFDLPPDLFTQLRDARTVTLALGRIRLNLDRDQVAVFRALGRRVEPAAP